ncbi:hypothetical protein F4778DRAFT_367719 [Xylariomycetidae sp. FL2044]|nr:hypothetical protein F4778DRAFT_367719 [Xylariomycetidae sp. FL2044]
MDHSSDFVIVGGGMAGLVVAARLTEDPSTSVIVLEAGNDHSRDPRIRTPALWLSILGTEEFDWNYRSTPQKGLDGKIVPLSQGKLLGGSSAINGQAFVANSQAAVDAWAQFGNPGWDWGTMAPYYKKSHTLSLPDPPAFDNLRLGYVDLLSARASDGPIRASFPDEADDPLPSAWVDTLAALGYPASNDPFSGEMTGGYVNAMTIDPDSRTRSDAVTGYLQPSISRPNLTVMTNSMVETVIFDKAEATPRALGVRVRKGAETFSVKANKEVILAAGAFGTPKLLQLAGIGSRTRLEALGIPVVVDNANVGENLQDHPTIGVSFEAADGVSTMDGMVRGEPEAVAKATEQYTTSKSGPLAVGGNFAGSLLPVVDFTQGPDSAVTLQSVLEATATAQHSMPGAFSPHHETFVRSLLGDGTQATGNIFMYTACGNHVPEGSGSDIAKTASTEGNFLTISAALLFPLSRGSVHIASRDPGDAPVIDSRYLEHPLDLEVIARHLRFVNTLVKTQPLSRYLKPHGRRSHGAPADLGDLDAVKKYARRAALSCWHPTSTCAMLPRERGGVTDPELCVYGVQGLRVVDSSIIPLATRGNPQTTVYAVAERAADLVKERWGIRT